MFLSVRARANVLCEERVKQSFFPNFFDTNPKHFSKKERPESIVLKNATPAARARLVRLKRNQKAISPPRVARAHAERTTKEAGEKESFSFLSERQKRVKETQKHFLFR